MYGDNIEVKQQPVVTVVLLERDATRLSPISFTGATGFQVTEQGLLTIYSGTNTRLAVFAAGAWSYATLKEV